MQGAYVGKVDSLERSIPCVVIVTTSRVSFLTPGGYSFSTSVKYDGDIVEYEYVSHHYETNTDYKGRAFLRYTGAGTLVGAYHSERGTFGAIFLQRVGLIEEVNATDAESG